MRIVAATPYYAPEGGGLERYAHETLRRLAARGHEVQVLTATRGAPGRAELDGVLVEREKPRRFAGNAPLHPGLARRLARHARDADVVLAHGPVPGPIEAAGVGAGLAGRPFVATYHAGALTSTRASLRAAAALDRVTLEAFALARADRLVAVSDFVRDKPLARHRGKTDVIPPGVDLRFFRPGPREREPEILFVGPLDPSYAWKGYHALFHAFRAVAARREDARLTLVGEGRDRERLLEWARHAGLEHRVRAPGRLSREDLRDAYQRAATVVLPSTTDAESFGMVLAEANACGTPVVGSNAGGIPCFVREGVNGLLAPPGDAHGLAQAVLHLLDNPEKAHALGEAGRRLVERDHDWDLIAKRTESVLLRAAEGSPVRCVTGPAGGESRGA